MKLGMGSSRRNTREGKRDEEEGEEGKEGLERLEKRKDGEEEEDWESLRERPVAMLVVGVQRRWREVRESEFTTISGLGGFEGPRFSWRSSRGNGRERDEEGLPYYDDHQSMKSLLEHSTKREHDVDEKETSTNRHGDSDSDHRYPLPQSSYRSSHFLTPTSDSNSIITLTPSEVDPDFDESGHYHRHQHHQ
ncbi:hypothetical protein K435DRAFT_458221 [Dendrothele bispora CBS 962.96]|uniref:Uncharacterized protein n=1 Tax=Dendrothele bispora (strain CBS 962.96) TaxID=1314807 RepID=A0A4S8MCT3_DENBC|nr:hypothetical protein K435DRAFT_458221 [Dendrothele bispora CBS 962.96]